MMLCCYDDNNYTSCFFEKNMLRRLIGEERVNKNYIVSATEMKLLLVKEKNEFYESFLC